jgi:hypothetical protein
MHPNASTDIKKSEDILSAQCTYMLFLTKSKHVLSLIYFMTCEIIIKNYDYYCFFRGRHTEKIPFLGENMCMLSDNILKWQSRAVDSSKTIVLFQLMSETF